MKITSKGQVTIPQALRERFGLLLDTEVEFVATANGKELRLVKSSKPSNRGRALVERWSSAYVDEVRANVPRTNCLN